MLNNSSVMNEEITCTFNSLAIMSSLRQFKCHKCHGKHGQKYHLWHERVQDSDPRSKCFTCGELCEPVSTGEEEGVKICHFTCTCDNTFVVQCKMSNTAPCYACNEEEVSPHLFEKLRKIDKKTDNIHNCSECGGRGNCPNMKCQPAKEQNVHSENDGPEIQCNERRG